MNTSPSTFEEFPKIARLTRECVITEKIDGSNAQVLITEEGAVIAGSRTRIITPEEDNFGFARWVKDHEEELRKLGVGRHFGEWWGAGIQRRYGQSVKKFSLFNVARWSDNRDKNKFPEERPTCCDVVPLLYRGIFNTLEIEGCVERLRNGGSVAAPGFMNPEGIIIWHESARIFFKKTLEKDNEWKGKSA